MKQVANSIEEFLSDVHLDFVPAQRQPTLAQFTVATVVALLASIGADAALIALGTTVFPQTAHYAHFQFGDYATLTVIGVLIASVGWPIIARVSLTPRWIYCRMAVVVSIVLLAPDAYIWLIQSQGAQGVFVLVWMHIAIAVITYLVMTRIAPAGPVDSLATRRAQP